MQKLSYSTNAQGFHIFYMLISFATFVTCYANIVTTIKEMGVRKQIKALLETGITKTLFDELDRDGNGQVDLAEFLHVFLVKLGRCSPVDMDVTVQLYSKMINAKADKLDARGRLKKRSSEFVLSSFQEQETC
jgi:hypothetical protein